jgi:hypothetical protein
MGTFITQDNWLLRRIGAAIFGWGTTIYTPVSPPNIISVANSREYFHDWPEDWSLKIKGSCGGSFGRLRLEVEQTEVFYSNTTEMYQSDIDYYLGGDPIVLPNQYAGGLYSDVRWGGDDHQYDSYTVKIWGSLLITNPGDPGHPTWVYDEATVPYTFPTNYAYNTVTYDTGALSSPYTGPTSASYIHNPRNYTSSNGPYVGEAVDMTGATILTPQDVLDGWGTSRTTSAYYYNHKPGASHWNKSASVSMFRSNISADINYDQFYLQEGITFVWDESWPACGYIQKFTTNLRWKYDPQSSVGCKWWEGYQASVKIAYKRATVTRTSGPNGVFLTIGTFTAAGDNTQTITLHDKYTEEYVSSTITMPTAEGYVYVIDDIEVLSVTKP